MKKAIKSEEEAIVKQMGDMAEFCRNDRLEEIKERTMHNPEQEEVFEFVGEMKSYFSELFVIIKDLKKEKDSETRWASHYLKEAGKLEVKLEKAKEEVKRVSEKGVLTDGEKAAFLTAMGDE